MCDYEEDDESLIYDKTGAANCPLDYLGAARKLFQRQHMHGAWMTACPFLVESLNAAGIEATEATFITLILKESLMQACRTAGGSPTAPTSAAQLEWLESRR